MMNKYDVLIFSAAKPRSRHRASLKIEGFRNYLLLSRGHFGGLSWPFWRAGFTHLGSFWGHFGGSGRLQGTFWLLGALGPPPGWLRGASGTLLGSLLGPKMAPWGP